MIDFVTWLSATVKMQNKHFPISYQSSLLGVSAQNMKGLTSTKSGLQLTNLLG